MATITVRGHDIEVDIESELREYDFGYNARWSSDKLIASSPFRSDTTPSFFVNITGDYAGVFGDSGAVDLEYASGGFAKLLGYLRGTSTEEAEEYLLDAYGNQFGDSEEIRLPTPKLPAKRRLYRRLDESTVTQATSTYLLRRGISEEVQALFGVGYNDKHYGFTAIPWRHADGRLANVKYRATKGKRFFYEKGATPIRELVYGADVLPVESSVAVVIVEGEIDAMSWWTAGIPAIALGGANITRAQADIIRRSPIKTLLLGGDNDETGSLLNRKIEKALRWDVRMYDVDYGEYKDANEVLLAEGVEGLCRIAERSQKVSNGNLFTIRNNNVK